MSDINLLPRGNSSSLAGEHAAALFQRVSIIVLTVTSFISIVIFILVLQSPLSKAKQEEDDLTSQISKSSEKISRMVILQERLLSIDTLLKTRHHYESDLTTILSALPAGISLSSLTIGEKTMELSGNTTSLDDTSTFFTSLAQLKEKKQSIKSVTVKSLALQTSGNRYFFTLAISLL